MADIRMLTVSYFIQVRGGNRKLHPFELEQSYLS